MPFKCKETERLWRLNWQRQYRLLNPVPKSGRPIKPMEERKVQVYGYVARKYYNEVQNRINEILKEYK